jgi:hypothetical protein
MAIVRSCCPRSHVRSRSLAIGGFGAKLRGRVTCAVRELLLEALSGELSEWLKVPDSKSGVLQGTGGSNPSLSARDSGRDNGNG